MRGLDLKCDNPALRLLKTVPCFIILTLISRCFAHATIDDAYNLIIPAGDAYVLEGSHVYSGDVIIYGTLYVNAYNDYTGTTGKLEITAPSLTVGIGGRIIADAKGYPSGMGPGGGRSVIIDSVSYGAGGSYGGIGSHSEGPTYGSIINPVDLGSGGGYRID